MSNRVKARLNMSRLLWVDKSNIFKNEYRSAERGLLWVQQELNMNKYVEEWVYGRMNNEICNLNLVSGGLFRFNVMQIYLYVLIYLIPSTDLALMGNIYAR